MQDDVATILLAEFRSFRSEINEWKQETGERITKMEVTVANGLIDNGHDCRMTAVEKRVDGLESIRLKTSGILLAIWSAITIALHFIPTPWSRH